MTTKTEHCPTCKSDNRNHKWVKANYATCNDDWPSVSSEASPKHVHTPYATTEGPKCAECDADLREASPTAATEPDAHDYSNTCPECASGPCHATPPPPTSDAISAEQLWKEWKLPRGIARRLSWANARKLDKEIVKFAKAYAASLHSSQPATGEPEKDATKNTNDKGE